MSKAVRIAISAALVVAWMCFIFSMSQNSADVSQGMSDGIIAKIAPYFIPGFDEMSLSQQVSSMEAWSYPVRKTAHFCEYLILCVLVFNLLRCIQADPSCKRSAKTTALLLLAAWVIATAYAGTDEFHQLFINGRSGQVSDVCLDSCGALVGALFAFIATFRR